VIARYGIEVVPIFINIGADSFLDGLDISREDFYSNLPTYDNHPSTAAPGPEMFRRVYERLLAQGATQILSIHVASSLSTTYNSARLAAESFQGAVQVFDSQQLTLGLGFLVETAAQALVEGADWKAIVARLEAQVERTYVFAMLDTLEFLRRSGRVNALVAGLGGLLRIKPLLIMHNGTPISERVRTESRARDRLVSLVADLGPLERAALVHTNAPTQAETLRQAAGSLLPPGELWSVRVTPVIGTHIGPGAAGIVCVAKPPAE
jgi:DegV family protein with EDD domain